MTELAGAAMAGRGRAAGPFRSHGRAGLALALLVLALVAAAAVSAGTGASEVSFSALASLLTGQALSARDSLILQDIRLPRIALGAMVGAALATSGALMQGLFRNPLADPGLVGVSAGASLGAVAIIVAGGGVIASLPPGLAIWALPLGAFIGGLFSTLALYAIATRGGNTSIATMLLAGIALAALSGAMTGALIYASDDTQLRDFTFWSMGSLAGATWEKVWLMLPFTLALVLMAPLLARGLNALSLGEAEAYYLGFRVERLKLAAVFLVAGSVGAAVAMSGGIGFVGIVVPHLLRLMVGADHRFLLPASAILGASLLIVADMVARVVVAPAELPIGIIMAMIGGPFFLWLILRRRSVLDG